MSSASFAHRYLPVFAASAFLCSGPIAPAAAAEDFISVPLLINSLKGAKVGKPGENPDGPEQVRRVKEIAKRINEIYTMTNKTKKEPNIEFTLDEAKIALDVEIAGVPANAQLNEAARKKVEPAGEKDLDDVFGKGKGMKIYFATVPQTEDLKARGVTYQWVKKGTTEIVKSSPISMMKFHDKTNDVKVNIRVSGQTAAHELGHGLNLDHVTDSDFLMYHGVFQFDFLLTDAEIKTAREIALQRGKVKEKENKDAPAVPKPEAKGEKPDAPKDNPAAPEFQNVISAAMSAVGTDLDFDVLIALSDLIPPAGASGTYRLLFDSDNNGLTGGPIGSRIGIDRVVRVDLLSDGSATFALDVFGGGSLSLAGEIMECFEIHDLDEPDLATVGSVFRSGFHMKLPKSLLALSGGRFHTVTVLATDSSVLSDEFDFVLDSNDELTGPQLSSTLGFAGPSQSIPLTGSNYTPNGNVELLVGNAPAGSVAAAPDGTITASVSAPQCSSTSSVFVYGRDSAGGDYGFTVISLVANRCDANCDGSVNAFDIAPFVDLITSVGPTQCSPCAGDTNADGSVNLFDIHDFVRCLGG